MPSANAVLLVAAAGFGFSLSPGPSMFYVLSRSISQSRSAGLASAFGLALGGMALAVLTALGAGAILRESTLLFGAVKVVGGLYLLYLGVRVFYSLPGFRHTADRVAQIESENLADAEPLTDLVRQGFLVELFNPKTVLFFLAFLPGFVDQDAGSIGLQMLVLGLLIPLTAIPSDISVSLVAGSLAQRVRTDPRMGMSLELISAVILVALGFRVLWSI